MSAHPGMQGDWKQRPEGGGRFAIRLIAGIARAFGRRLTRLLLYPITGYFLLVRGPERRASRQYLSQVLGRPAGLCEAARHVHTFASTILDRVFLLGGRLDLFEIQVTGLDALKAALAQQRGALVFGSHLGSFDALRVLKRLRGDLALRVVLDKRHNAAISEVFDALDPALAAGIIDAGADGHQVALQIKHAAEQGAMVAMLVDRAQPQEPALAVNFFGRPAPFPTTPWLIASALKLPVVLAYGVYRGGNRYELIFESFRDVADVPRGERAAALHGLIGDYAARLQQHALDAPYNWFNFYDFWQEGVRDRVADGTGLRRRDAVRRCG